MRPMNISSFPATTRPNQQPNKWREIVRQPTFLIVLWVVYSLVALGYFGYQSAWFGTLCTSPL
jgi:hypothetical protein